MDSFIDKIFSDRFMPHGYCFLWRPELVWIHALADLAIAIAYISIPVIIFFVLAKKRRDIPFAWVFTMLASFIFLGGLIHIMEIISIWNAFYYLEGILKIITAAISIATAILLFPLVPVLIRKFEELNQSANRNDTYTRNYNKNHEDQ